MIRNATEIGLPTAPEGLHWTIKEANFGDYGERPGFRIQLYLDSVLTKRWYEPRSSFLVAEEAIHAEYIGNKEAIRTVGNRILDAYKVEMQNNAVIRQIHGNQWK